MQVRLFDTDAVMEAGVGRLRTGVCYHSGSGSSVRPHAGTALMPPSAHGQVHLFDIDIPGGVTFKESETLTAGRTGTVVDTDAGRLGIGICYDIRFPELAMMYAQRGAQLLVYPGALLCSSGGRPPCHLWVAPWQPIAETAQDRAGDGSWRNLQQQGIWKQYQTAERPGCRSTAVEQVLQLLLASTQMPAAPKQPAQRMKWHARLAGAFNTTTGPAHWELLQKARAVDNQLFVATCSPARNSELSYQAWGHSTAVDPFGKASLAYCDAWSLVLFCK